jgi:hypothetical protein
MTKRCKCKTLLGTRCERIAVPGKSYCWQHCINRSITNSCNSTRKKTPPKKKRHSGLIKMKYIKN